MKVSGSGYGKLLSGVKSLNYNSEKENNGPLRKREGFSVTEKRIKIPHKTREKADFSVLGVFTRSRGKIMRKGAWGD